MKNKEFNAVAMKREGAERVHQRTKKMSRIQELAFWASRSEELRREHGRGQDGEHPARDEDPLRADETRAELGEPLRDMAAGRHSAKSKRRTR